MVFGNGVKNIQAAAYNGARTVYKVHITKIERTLDSDNRNSITKVAQMSSKQ